MPCLPSRSTKCFMLFCFQIENSVLDWPGAKRGLFQIGVIPDALLVRPHLSLVPAQIDSELVIEDNGSLVLLRTFLGYQIRCSSSNGEHASRSNATHLLESGLVCHCTI
ncbi:hypothetical protein FKM82_023332 [Ascaphus truei]